MIERSPRLAPIRCLAGWLLLFVVSLALALSLGWSAGSPAQTPPPAPSAIASGHQLLQQGVEHYNAERFAAAATSWQQAAAALQADPLGQVLALSNLSLTYQQLAQWPAAKTAIDQSLARLKTVAPTTPAYAEILAKARNTQGNWFWSQGQAAAALKAWQAAAQHYQQAGQPQGWLMAHINQAKAWQDLGHNIRAVEQLQQVERLLDDPRLQAPADLPAIGRRQLGVAYRRIGNLEKSEQLLQASVATAQPAASAAYLELGNTQKALGDQALAIGKVELAETYAQAALQVYQAAVPSAASPLLQLQAQLNQLKLLLELGQWPAAAALVPQMQPRLWQLPPSRAALYAQLNFAASLSCRQSDRRPTCASPDRSPSLSLLPTPAKLVALVTQTLAQARQLADPLTESYALGQLGQLYELQGQWATAQTFTQQALLRLEGHPAPEAAYQWAWQLGRLLRQQQQLPSAIAAYREAIRHLATVQGDLLLINRETRFSFRDQVEPVYRELVDLLLQPPDNRPPGQAQLKLAIETIDALQLVELKNFLGCELPRVRIDQNTVDPTAAKIYPLLLPDRLAIILEIAHEPLRYYETPAPQATVTATIQALRNALIEPGQTPEVLQAASTLHHWLLAPLLPGLTQQEGLKTLVFVPDRELRNIPMGVLYDGQQYLIEQFAIAIAPRLELFQPQPLSPNLTILAGGVGLPQTIEGESFPAIPQLQAEIAQIPAAMLTTPPLFDQAFTIANIEQRLQSGRYSAIHWKTHGIFSSDPMATYIVAYQSSIRTNDLINIVQGSRQTPTVPLELLVLSACETARGDNRAVLGMAGTALNAGASSILSALWRADDAANTALTGEFYQALTQAGTSRAAALRQAQLALLNQYGYAAPYYWATYVLVGNWL